MFEKNKKKRVGRDYPLHPLMHQTTKDNLKDGTWLRLMVTPFNLQKGRSHVRYIIVELRHLKRLGQSICKLIYAGQTT